MAKLTVTRGLPGSGKTTAARATGDLCVSRDDIRQMLYGKRYGEEGVDEQAVTVAEEAVVYALMRAGRDVVVHDTCLDDEYLRAWEYMAYDGSGDGNPQFEVIDLRGMPLRVCINRDAQRAHPVGEEAIIEMYMEYIKDLDL